MWLSYRVCGACFASTVISSAHGSTCWARACTSGSSARRCCSRCWPAASTDRTSTSLRRRRDARASGSSPRTGATCPPRRDTAEWRLGLHGRRHRSAQGAARTSLPRLAALGALLAGVVNLASAVTPNIAWRSHLLLQVAPLQALRLSHAIAVPASLLLLATAPYLWRRRRGALRLAIGLLVGLAALDLLKGLDVEPAAGSLGLAAILWPGAMLVLRPARPGHLALDARLVPARGAGRPDAVRARRLDRRAGRPRASRRIVRGDLRGAVLAVGTARLPRRARRRRRSGRRVGLLALAGCLGLLLRPLAAPRSLPDVDVRRAVRRLSTATARTRSPTSSSAATSTTSSVPDGRAFVGYRVEAGVLLVSGDPVGAADALPALFRRLGAFAEARGLKLAAVGVGETLLPALASSSACARSTSATRRSSTRPRFSLEGRAIRKVRQSVSRLEKAGYAAELVEVGRAGRRHAAPSSTRSAAAGARARPSVASRCRSTRFAATTTATASCCSPATATAAPAASFTSRRATGRPASLALADAPRPRTRRTG